MRNVNITTLVTVKGCASFCRLIYARYSIGLLSCTKTNNEIIRICRGVNCTVCYGSRAGAHNRRVARKQVSLSRSPDRPRSNSSLSHCAEAVFPRAGRAAAQTAFRAGSLGFAAATANPQAAQRRLLKDLTSRCERTQYGLAHGVRTPEDFLTRLPVVDYQELAPWLAAQRQAERRTLVADRVLFYEKTSGSSGPAKYIPYTAALRGSFTRMFAVWADDLLRHGPRLRTGAFYFSISPSFGREQRTEQGVPVGLEDDADYLGPLLKRALSSLFVIPTGAANAPDADTWKRCVARALVLRGDLEIISVWNPSMLLVILDTIEAQRHELQCALGLDPRRAALAEPNIDWAVLWPELKLVSCWTSAAAAPLGLALARRLPGVMVQGKGLLATEAPLTIPLLAAGGFVPMIDQVFYELEDVQTKQLSLLHEAVLGRSYELVISQKGGLCRYRMGDRVRVTHFYGATPCLDFIGRGHDTSDLVGEKLQEGFVAEALREFSHEVGSFWSLVPARSPHDHYVLLLNQARSQLDQRALAARVDAALRKAYHYEHARALGQLGPVRVVASPRAAELIRDHQLRRGMKWGDIKHRLLFTEPADALLQELAVP